MGRIRSMFRGKNKKTKVTIGLLACLLALSFTIAFAANTVINKPDGTVYVQITEDTIFNIPRGVTSIKAVIIGGGSGGQAGEPGTAGQNGVGAILVSQVYTSQVDAGGSKSTGGAGGRGGVAGSPGKVNIVNIDTSAVSQLNITVGKGGTGGIATSNAEPGANGTEGTASSITVGGTTYSSNDGTVLPTGYFDEQSLQTYASQGRDGYNGGDGGASGWATLYADSFGSAGGNVATYNGGAYSEHSVTSGRYYYSGSTVYYNAIIGHLSAGGGGAAYGADGGAAADKVAGTGANAIPFETPIAYGSGGHGGNGGGGGGGGSPAYFRLIPVNPGSKEADCWINGRSGSAGGLGSNGTNGVQGVVLLTYEPPTLKVSQHPESTSVSVGGNATFRAEDNFGGVGISYQWYKAADAESNGTLISGATSKTYTITNAATTRNNSYYYCSMTDGNTTVRTNGAKLSVYGAPTANPLTTVTYNGTIVGNGEYLKAPFTFSISIPGVAGAGTTVTEYSLDGGATWATYTGGNVQFADDTKTQVTIHTKAYNSGDARLKTQASTTVYLDKVKPSVSINGLPENWTKNDVTITVTASDGGVGLPADAYWFTSSEGWVTTNSHTYSSNYNGIIKVQDKLGNVAEETLNIAYIDKTAPTITTVTGNPGTWQKDPCTVTVTATDGVGSGLHAEAYSFDGGASWQSENYITVTENRDIDIVVRDAVENPSAITTYRVSKIDKTAPQLNVSYLALSDDRNFVVTELIGTDTESGNVEFCFNFDELNPETAVWQSEKIESLAAGTQVTVACKDAAGNIAKQTIRPTEYSVAAGGAAGGGGTGNLPIFTQNVLSCAGYTLGGGDTATKFMRENGTTADYTTYSVGGTSVVGLAVSISAAPTKGGVLSGYAEISGQKFPIYWDPVCSQMDSDIGGTGTIIIDKTKLRASARNTTITVRIDEYEDTTKTRIVNTETIRDSISVDASAPVVSVFYNAATAQVEVTARDAMAGIGTATYTVKDDGGNALVSGADYRTPYTVTQRCRVEAVATDKLGNTTTKLSNMVEPSGGAAGGAPAGETYPSYRTYYFEYYIEGV